MQKDAVVLGHCHHFAHPTFVQDGELEISLLKATEVNADGNPLHAEVERVFTVKATDPVNFHLIPAGRWHSLRALTDNTRYQCIYPHRTPTSLTLGLRGQRDKEPHTRVDKNGDLWVRVERGIVEDAAGWAAAYE